MKKNQKRMNEENKTKFDEAIVITDNHPEEHDNFSYILEENTLVDCKILIDCSIWLSSSRIDLMLNHFIKEYVNYNADKKDTSFFTLSRIDQIKKMNGILRVNNDVEMIFILNVRNHWIVITNFCRSLDIYANEQELYIYDSFNDDMLIFF